MLPPNPSLFFWNPIEASIISRNHKAKVQLLPAWLGTPSKGQQQKHDDLMQLPNIALFRSQNARTVGDGIDFDHSPERLKVSYYFLGGSEVIYHQRGLERIENLGLRLDPNLVDKAFEASRIRRPKHHAVLILGTPELDNPRNKTAHT